MSEKEKNFLEQLAKLPPELQDRMADQLAGAVTAVEVLAAKETEKKAG